jgi:hypothetical protein
MLALYRAGRTPDALAAHSSIRRQLLDEFGDHAQPQLQRLIDAMLRADPALDAPQGRQDGVKPAPVRRHPRRWRGRLRTIRTSGDPSATPPDPDPREG